MTEKTDWLRDLQAARSGIVSISNIMRMKGMSCFDVGLNAHGDYLYRTSDRLDAIADLINNAAGDAVSEIYDSAQQSSMSMLSAVLAFSELKAEEAADGDTGQDS